MNIVSNNFLLFWLEDVTHCQSFPKGCLRGGFSFLKVDICSGESGSLQMILKKLFCCRQEDARCGTVYRAAGQQGSRAAG